MKWSYTTANEVLSSPAIGSDGAIYVGSMDGKLYAVTTTGTLKWSYSTGGTIDTPSPAIGSDGTIYVGSSNGKLYAVTSSSTGGLASSSWPMFHHDNQHTGNINNVNGSPGITTTKIALTSIFDGKSKIYVMNIDGSQQRRVTDNSSDNDDPTWSPDGKKIAFTSNRDGNYEIYVMNADGSNQRNVSNDRYSDESEPKWSPDGAKIAFTSYFNKTKKMYIMKMMEVINED